MNHELTPSLLNYNGQLIETYSRESKANEEVREELGLPINEPVKANIGLIPNPHLKTPFSLFLIKSFCPLFCLIFKWGI